MRENTPKMMSKSLYILNAIAPPFFFLAPPTWLVVMGGWMGVVVVTAVGGTYKECVLGTLKSATEDVTMGRPLHQAWAPPGQNTAAIPDRDPHDSACTGGTTLTVTRMTQRVCTVRTKKGGRGGEGSWRLKWKEMG